MGAMKIVAIVGGGYSGVSVALNLNRLATQPMNVILFEQSPAIALGAAYSTNNPAHLLNVRANNMSAFADEPNHFVEWLTQDDVSQRYLDKSLPIGQQFLPRCIYGRYLQSLWRDMIKNPNPNLHMVLQHEEVVAINKMSEDIWQLQTAVNKMYQANAVILAVGNFAPNKFAEHVASDKVLNNPWQDGVLNRIGSHDSVLIVGTGLTMVDMVMSLKSQNHQGKIFALARRACLPQRHQNFELQDLWGGIRLPNGINTLTKLIRAKVHEVESCGGDWRVVVDALRTYTQDIWQSLSIKDQKRFLRHLVPYWDTHRHRIAEQIADVIVEHQNSGRLEIIAGRINDVLLHQNNLRIEYRSRGAKDLRYIDVDWFVNCTGPNTNFKKMRQGLLSSMLAKNLISTDSLALGLRTNEYGQLLSLEGVPSGSLYTLAAVCKPLLWECIAVPDVRSQSLLLAKQINSKT